MAKEGIINLALRSALPQANRYIRRVFAEGHQLAQTESSERVPASSARKIERSLLALRSEMNKSRLVCVIDNGMGEVRDGILKIPADRAPRARVLYEPRSPHFPEGNAIDIINLNEHVMRALTGMEGSTDAEALNLAKAILVKAGVRGIIYTRRERGMLMVERVNGSARSFSIVPERRPLFDLVSVGDVVTAALAFCLGRGYSLFEAVCFAATAAELSLDNRFDKHLKLSDIFDRSQKK